MGDMKNGVRVRLFTRVLVSVTTFWQPVTGGCGVIFGSVWLSLIVESRSTETSLAVALLN